MRNGSHPLPLYLACAFPFFISLLHRPRTCLHHGLIKHSCSVYVIHDQDTSLDQCTKINTRGQEESETTAGSFLLCARQVCPSLTTYVRELATHEILKLRNSNKADRYQALDHRTDSTEALDIIDSLCLRIGACRVHEACTRINLVLAAEA